MSQNMLSLYILEYAVAWGALNDKGFLLGIATGKSRRGLQRTLNQHALLDFFRF